MRASKDSHIDIIRGGCIAAVLGRDDGIAELPRAMLIFISASVTFPHWHPSSAICRGEFSAPWKSQCTAARFSFLGCRGEKNAAAHFLHIHTSDCARAAWNFNFSRPESWWWIARSQNCSCGCPATDRRCGEKVFPIRRVHFGWCDACMWFLTRRHCLGGRSGSEECIIKNN